MAACGRYHCDLTGVFGFLPPARKAHLLHRARHELVVVFDDEYAINIRRRATRNVT